MRKPTLLTAFGGRLFTGITLPVLALGLLPVEAAAQRRAIEVVVENDAFVSWLPGRRVSDREYTHGMWIAVVTSEAPLWGRVLPDTPACGDPAGSSTACLETRLQVGQKIFTPDISEPIPSPTERPYAAWLFGAADGQVLKASAARNLRVELGVTGPPALGEPFQRLAHRVTGFGQPRGWDHQLAFEPGVLLQYGERRVLERATGAGTRIADLVASSTVSLGTVRTGLEGGLLARAGYRLPHPWQPAPPERGLVTFGFGKVRQRWVGRDLFLDGNTFRSGPSVEKRPFTAAAELGAALQYLGYRVTYAMIGESRLYATQPIPHLFSSIILSVHR